MSFDPDGFDGPDGLEGMDTPGADQVQKELSEIANLNLDTHPLRPGRNERHPIMTTAKNTSVLFVCVHNAGRSQMAAGFLTHYAGDRVTVRSAGSAPAGSVNPAVLEAMKEVGIDLSAETPKVLTDEAALASDYIITMGCGDACPVYPGKKYLDWVLQDPAGQGVDAVRPIRDEIEGLIRSLIDEIDAKNGAV